MTTLQVLTIRRTAALAKLATLQRRAERLPAAASSTVTSALAELTSALEHLQIATDQLEEQATELANTRRDLRLASERLDEFAAIVPVPCVWAERDGAISSANQAAAECLNVAASRLVGRPLLLFVAERSQFMDALAALNEGVTDIVEIKATIRPRERRPRPVRLRGRRLRHESRRCWFILND